MLLSARRSGRKEDARTVLEEASYDRDRRRSLSFLLLSFLRPRLLPSLAQPTLLLSVSHLSYVVDSAGLWSDEELVSDISLLFQIHLCYSDAVISPYNLDGPEIVNAILKALRIQETSILFFRLPTRASEGYLAIFEPLKAAQRLEHIACEADACYLFTSILAHTSMSEGGPVNAHDQAIPFPRPRYVKLLANLSDIGKELQYHFDSIGPVISVDKLEAILERREALGVLLDRLETQMYPGAIYPKHLDQPRAAAENTVLKAVDW